MDSLVRMARPLLVAAALLSTLSVSARADNIDDFVAAQLLKRHIPGLSLAIIQDGKIIKVQGYGVTEKNGETPVTPSTLFQAGAISKPVTALAALHLVEQGKLLLDEDVNAKLTSWKVPENEFTKDKKVTLRGILAHSVGLTTQVFSGYEVGAAVPSLVQILNGETPANTSAIRVDAVPGGPRRYSGGGFTVLQQLMLDVTGTPFPQLLRETVLTPLKMTHSAFEQPLSADNAALAATGHDADGKAVKGRWRIYPELAAEGLWTTPSDLARFVIGLQDSYMGKSNPVISQTMARQMLTRQTQNSGLGVVLAENGNALRFSSNAGGAGFRAVLLAYAEMGQGAVIMVNSSEDSPMADRLLEVIAKEYHWVNYPVRPILKPIEDKEPEVTARLRGVFEQFAQGVVNAPAFAPERPAFFSAALKQGLQGFLSKRGTLQSFALVERFNYGPNPLYRYLLTYKDGSQLTALCVLNKEGKIDSLTISPE